MKLDSAKLRRRKQRIGLSGARESGNRRRAESGRIYLATWLQTWYELYAKPHLLTRQMQESAAEKMGNFMAQVM